MPLVRPRLACIRERWGEGGKVRRGGGHNITALRLVAWDDKVSLWSGCGQRIWMKREESGPLKAEESEYGKENAGIYVYATCIPSTDFHHINPS